MQPKESPESKSRHSDVTLAIKFQDSRLMSSGQKIQMKIERGDKSKKQTPCHVNNSTAGIAHQSNYERGAHIFLQEEKISALANAFLAHRKSGSIGLKPTRGESEIMRHLGEDAYS